MKKSLWEEAEREVWASSDGDLYWMMGFRLKWVKAGGDFELLEAACRACISKRSGGYINWPDVRDLYGREAVACPECSSLDVNLRGGVGEGKNGKIAMVVKFNNCNDCGCSR